MTAPEYSELSGPFPDDAELPDIPFDIEPRTHPAKEAQEGYTVRYWAKVYELPGGASEIGITRFNSFDLDKFTHRGSHGGRGPSKATRDPKEAEECKRVAVRRARKRVRHITKALEADHLLTLTYRENMEDVDRLKRDWAQFVRYVRARYNDWKFLCVKERQQRGAFHIHAAVVGHQNVKFLRICWLRIVGEGGGNIDVRGPRRRWGGRGYKWRASKLAAYLCKYISKDFETSEHHSKRYWLSKGIVIEKPLGMWLRASTEIEALQEALELANFFGMKNITIWHDKIFKHLWLGGALD